MFLNRTMFPALWRSESPCAIPDNRNAVAERFKDAVLLPCASILFTATSSGEIPISKSLLCVFRFFFGGNFFFFVIGRVVFMFVRKLFRSSVILIILFPSLKAPTAPNTPGDNTPAAPKGCCSCPTNVDAYYDRASSAADVRTSR